MAVVAGRLRIRDNSFLWHVTAGTMQNDSGAVLISDPFSFTFAGRPWRTQSWLLDIGYDVAHRAVQLGFVPFLVAGAALVTFACVLLAAYRASRSVEATALIGVLTAWLSAIFLNPRPVIVSYLLLAVIVVVAGDRRLRWTIPLIVWVWASMHGSFVLGIGYVVLDGLRRRDRAAATDTVAAVVAASLTAHGLGVWEVLLEFARSREALSLITEWRTPNLTGVELAPFLVGIVLLVVGGIRGRLRMADLWVVVPFLVFGLAATRSVFPAWIPLAPLAAASLDGLPHATPARRSPVIVTVALVLVVFPIVLPVRGGLSDRFPLEAAAALTDDRVFHDDAVGGYLIYRFGGERQVFVDDRAELYTADHFRDVVAARSGTPTWRDTFDEWSITQAILRSDDGLVRALAEAGWSERYRDDDFVVYDAP